MTIFDKCAVVRVTGLWAGTPCATTDVKTCPICGAPVSGLLTEFFPGVETTYWFNVDSVIDPDCGPAMNRVLGINRENGLWGKGRCPEGWWENPPVEFREKIDRAVNFLRERWNERAERANVTEKARRKVLALAFHDITGPESMAEIAPDPSEVDFARF